MSEEKSEGIKQMVDQYFDQISKVIAENSESSVNMGMEALRIEALNGVLPFAIMFVVAIIAWRFAWTYRYFRMSKNEVMAAKSKDPGARAISEDWFLQALFGRKSSSVHEDDEIPEDVEVGDVRCYRALSVVTLVVSTGAFFISLIGLSDVWAWVGVFNPELYAIHMFVLD